jgi:HSP20 family molecular chaperone IbpA
MPDEPAPSNLLAMSQLLDTMVVTCGVPCESLDELDLTVFGHTVAVAGPYGFRHELELPDEADMSGLTVELDKGFLELRAPRRVPAT